MDRTELRAIERRLLSPEQSTATGDVEMNAVINQGITELTRDLGGVMQDTDLTTDADGLATLPTALIRLKRVIYDGDQLGKCDLNDI